MKKHIQKGKMKNQKGITLLVLVITIIVLLILAGITISAITGDNGIIGNAGQAKEETEIANEKEIVEKATVQAMGDNKYGNIEESELQSELDKETGEGKTETTDIGDEFEVVFIDSNRYYVVDKDGNVGEAQEIIKDKNPGDITVGKDGEALDGSEEHPYEIWCIEDLIEWSQHYTKYQNSNIVLCKDLNFKSSLSYADSESMEYGDINQDNTTDSLIEEMQKGIGFTPIANFSGAFNGEYEEEKHKIENIFIYVEGNAGLFERISGTISNINITGEIMSKNSYAGGIASIGGDKALISNCVNNCNVKTNSKRENANGSSYGSAGGIVGRANKMIINNCVNNGEIYGTENAGGISGYEYAADVTILNCANTGKVYSEENSGGIFAGTVAGSVKIYNCYNIGDILGLNAGGLLGYKYHTTNVEIRNCYHYANILGENRTRRDYRIYYGRNNS